MDTKNMALRLFRVLLWLAHCHLGSSTQHRSHHGEQCMHILNYKFGEETCTKSENSFPPHNKTKCKNTPYCPGHLNITEIDYWPFHPMVMDQLKDTLSRCCGDCKQTILNTDVQQVLVTDSPYLNLSDMVYPVFGSRMSTKVYGRWFIPFMDVPSGVYIVKKKSSRDIVNEVLESIMDLWPLLVILLILAMLAGFVAWVIETWTNTEEFSRNFVVGMLDGFWWAYVSMTTVGYGDKSTITITGRLFSVVWILMGITIFSMLTASLTDIITSSNVQTSTDMRGKKIGLLAGRPYDAELVTRNGGILDIINLTHAGKGIDIMLDRVEETGEGFVVDEDTFYFYMAGWPLTAARKFQLENNIIRTRKTIGGDMTLGILVRDEAVYNYLAPYVENNWVAMDTCRLNMITWKIQSRNFKEPRDDEGIFSTEGGLFFPTLKASCVLLAIALVFGFSYEAWKRWKRVERVESRNAIDSCANENGSTTPVNNNF